MKKAKFLFRMKRYGKWKPYTLEIPESVTDNGLLHYLESEMIKIETERTGDEKDYCEIQEIEIK